MRTTRRIVLALAAVLSGGLSAAPATAGDGILGNLPYPPQVSAPRTFAMPYKGCAAVPVAWRVDDYYMDPTPEIHTISDISWTMFITMSSKDTYEGWALSWVSDAGQNAPQSGVNRSTFKVCKGVNALGPHVIQTQFRALGDYSLQEMTTQVVKPTPVLSLRRATSKGRINVRVQASVTGYPMAKRKVVVYKKRSGAWKKAKLKTNGKGVARYKSRAKPGKAKIKVCTTTTADYVRSCTKPITVKVR